MNEFDPTPAPDLPVVENVESTAETPGETAAADPGREVNPIRAAAGRLGGQRVHRLAELGREYEKEHGLTPGRQRLKQLIQLGKRYEAEHGLRIARPRRRKTGDAWPEFVLALARIVRPQHRAAVEQLAAALRPVDVPANKAA